MQSQYLQMMQDFIRLAGLTALVGGAVAVTRPKPREIEVAVLPAVKPFPEIIDKLKPAVIKTTRTSSETARFLRMPTELQRQALDYADRWRDANFEAKSLTKTG